LIREVIFDTDPSPDDAVAFLAAIASPEDLRVLAITTVAGNVPVGEPTSPSMPGPRLRWCGPW
jgi:purine nucleosidase